VLFYKNAKTHRKANSIQAGALAQKEVLMKELHHRVKNNLQVISTLLELQQENVTDKVAKDAINESASRLRSILLIHKQLYTGDQLTEIDCAHFASELMVQINAIFSQPGQNITFNNMEMVILDVDTSIQVGLMLNELITNSFKYAFPHSDGTIDLRIETAGHQHKLYYTDSGPGLPDGLDIYDPKTTGLGMMIMESLSKQLGGAFTYNRANNTFIISFRDAEGNNR
jgi:two-component sensor histidine kinase